ncbi:hypothetical protein EBQ93_05130, partial [bacterium]|nr:hypothetical protein [bacterium]
DEITLYSGTISADFVVDDDAATVGSYVGTSQIVLQTGGVSIYNIPPLYTTPNGRGLTYTGSLEYSGQAIKGAPNTNITQYRSSGNIEAGNGPSYNYGAAARYRVIIADPYDDNKLKRGLGIYYGTRSTVPTASTGTVGDLWVSWAS